MTDWIRLAKPPIGELEIQRATETLTSGYLVQGQQVQALEHEFRELVGTKEAVAVGSGTAALHLGLKALGVQDGATVATTAFSWPAAANSIELVGCETSFVDIEAGSYNLDTRLLETLLKSTAVAAILPVHAFGNSADMFEITRLAEEHGALVIEDAACAVGGRWNGSPLGSMGDVGCFSFHPRKIITSAEGGMVVTNDPAIAAEVRMLRDHGVSRLDRGFDVLKPGFNYRMTDLGAAILRPQLERLDELLRIRRDISDEYTTRLQDSPVKPQTLASGSKSAIQAYVVSIPNYSSTQRDEVIARLRSQRIETSIGTIHVPMTAYYADKYGTKPGDFPVTDQIADSSIALPLHHELNSADLKRVSDALRSAVDSMSSR